MRRRKNYLVVGTNVDAGHTLRKHTPPNRTFVCVCFVPKHTSESTGWVYKQQQHHPCYKWDDRRRRLRDRRQRRNYFIPQRLNLSECLVPGISSHCFILTVFPSFCLYLFLLLFDHRSTYCSRSKTSNKKSQHISIEPVSQATMAGKKFSIQKINICNVISHISVPLI